MQGVVNFAEGLLQQHDVTGIIVDQKDLKGHSVLPEGRTGHHGPLAGVSSCASWLGGVLHRPFDEEFCVLKFLVVRRSEGIRSPSSFQASRRLPYPTRSLLERPDQ